MTKQLHRTEGFQPKGPVGEQVNRVDHAGMIFGLLWDGSR